MALSWSSFGSRATGARLERMQRSPQYSDGRFRNTLPEVQGDMKGVMRKMLFGNGFIRVPADSIDRVLRTKADFAAPVPGVRVTWVGHSTILVEIEGHRILTDPVFSRNASPGRLFGVRRFYEAPLPIDQLPALDAVLISHDHYDHLDERAIRKLAAVVPRFLVPLGVGAHLEHWGVAPEKITELDWWEEATVGRDLKLICTPARHFSGRFLTDRNATLWAGWAIVGREKRVYYSGDSGMTPDFATIGDRLGPFDVTMIEIGAYNAAWADIHMGPEQAIQAHRMVRGGVMIPIHWATFNLALHAWTEPIERAVVAAEANRVTLALPRPGESVRPEEPLPHTLWWPRIPWQTALEAPIVSSGITP